MDFSKFLSLFRKKESQNSPHALLSEVLWSAKNTTQQNIPNELEDISLLFSHAIKKWASDIHIEPDEKNLNIRIRIDGNFVHHATLDESMKTIIAAKIKILGGLKIDEHRLPQDGKASFFDEENKKDVDLRISILPTIYGEKIVIRLLKKENEWIDLRSIWVLPMNMVKIKNRLQDNYGLILVVGPTGSGKSTTMHIMGALDTPSSGKYILNGKNIWPRDSWINRNKAENR